MTLNERFKNILFVYEIATEQAKIYRCEQIADDFAAGFAEWCYDNDIFAFNNVKELLEIYKKENNL